nr:MAG TPA: hypothetical protein [Caudoviricetes sp.]
MSTIPMRRQVGTPRKQQFQIMNGISRCETKQVSFRWFRWFRDGSEVVPGTTGKVMMWFPVERICA